jgi:hypothetical protein
MADIVYTVNQDSPENIPGFEKYTQNDKDILTSFEVNSIFDPTKHYSEIHIVSLSDELIESDYNYTSYRESVNAQSAGREGASILTVDPIADSKAYGYDGGGVKLLYHFLNDLYTKDATSNTFFVQELSEDRTEVKLQSLVLSTDDIISYTTAIKDKLQNTSYFNEFRLNFKNNDLFIGINIDTLDYIGGKVVVIKLYEPLPDIYDLKSQVSVVEVVSDSVAYEVDSVVVLPEEVQPTLRPANFNLEITDEHVIPTQYFNYDELFSYPVNNTNSQVYSLFNEKGVELSIDHSDFSNFVHFSSAQERLINFKYKLDLITSYSGSLASIGTNTISGSLGVSGSKTYYENLITGIVNNFDHYERFLYYESGSTSWPKSNTTKPYTNKPSNAAESITWYADQITTALQYDQTNYNSLVYSIPTFIRDDANNDNYSTFIYMIGQHFDNLWLYSKAVTDKYDGDNRLDHGISKDLVGEALKNFGVKLYTSNKSIEDLFTTYVGQSYQSGSEVINYYITGSLTGSNRPIQPTSYDDYQKEVQKRLYHNLPFLLKSKGTEKGLRALINCFGVPSDILKIKIYGGRNVNERPFFGDYQYYTSSLDKIRLDHTGSIVTGSTLSGNTSIVKRDPKYTDDLHNIEVGFSPTDNIDAYIISRSAATFSIDDYIGDPRDLTSENYSGLYDLAQTVTSGSVASGSYDLQDYVRLIKFFDNTIFKTIKDFIPARVVADTGIIIKPNLLNRSKAKSIAVSVTQPEYSGSIDTAFISGSHGNTFGRDDRYTTSWTAIEQTPLGLANSLYHSHEEPKFDGEFSGSNIQVSNGELNEANIYKQLLYNVSDYNIQLWNNTDTICILRLVNSPTQYVFDGTQYQASNFFAGNPTTTQYYLTNTATSTTTQINFSPFYTFTGLNQYDTLTLEANNVALEDCRQKTSITYGICDITTNQTAPVGWLVDNPITLSNYFQTNPVHTQIQYLLNDEPVNPVNYIFGPDEAGQTFTVTCTDVGLGGLCNSSYQLIIDNQTPADPSLYTFMTAYRLPNTSWGVIEGRPSAYAEFSWITYNPNTGLDEQVSYTIAPDGTQQNGYVLSNTDWINGTNIYGNRTRPYGTGLMLVKEGSLSITIRDTQFGGPVVGGIRAQWDGDVNGLSVSPYLSVSYQIPTISSEITINNTDNAYPIKAVFQGLNDLTSTPFTISDIFPVIVNSIVPGYRFLQEDPSNVGISIDYADETFRFSPSTVQFEYINEWEPD